MSRGIIKRAKISMLLTNSAQLADYLSDVRMAGNAKRYIKLSLGQERSQYDRGRSDSLTTKGRSSYNCTQYVWHALVAQLKPSLALDVFISIQKLQDTNPRPVRVFPDHTNMPAARTVARRIGQDSIGLEMDSTLLGDIS